MQLGVKEENLKHMKKSVRKSGLPVLVLAGAIGAVAALHNDMSCFRNRFNGLPRTLGRPLYMFFGFQVEE
jgi:hypothetical protein